MADNYSTWAIRSAIIGIIVLLMGIIGWLATSKDKSILDAIADVKNGQEKLGQMAKEWQIETRQADKQVLASVEKLCDRMGAVEGRVNNLEIFIQMPYQQRKEIINGHKTKEKP